MTQTGNMTDRVILDYHNGRPSMWVSVVDDQPQLHWLVLGYMEDFDVWVDVPLSWAEAEQVIKDPPIALTRFLSRHEGRPARLRLVQGSHVSPPLIHTTWVLRASKRLAEDAARVLADEYDQNRRTVGIEITPEQAEAGAALRELADAST